MHSERDWLIRHVFPELRQRLEAHRLYLEDIDLRWGVTREQAENNLAIELCLHQVLQSRPFFVGLIGQRYGWRPTALPPSTLDQFPWVAHFTGRSVTELEILCGTQKAEWMPRALFFFRSPEATETIPPHIREAVFVDPPSDDPGSDARCLDNLKWRLEREWYLPVEIYNCRWDGDAYEKTGRLVDLNRFGALVLERLWEAIRDEHRLPEVPPEKAAVDPIEAEAAHHNRFREIRRRIFVGRDQDLAFLRRFAQGDDRVPCLVTGPVGIGKSALLAELVTRLQNEPTSRPSTPSKAETSLEPSFAADLVRRGNSESEPSAESVADWVILSHFVGASEGSTDLGRTLRRLAQEISRQFKLPTPIPEDLDNLKAAFRGLLFDVPKSSRLLLVIDAVDQLDPFGQSHELFWLPEELPPHVKLIVSAPSDLPLGRNAVWQALGRRVLVRREVPPLGEPEGREILRQVPSLAGKALGEDQAHLFLACPATTNPLYLRVALEEMRGLSYERVNEFIRSLPTGRDGNPLLRLFDQMLARLESEFGGRPFVERVLVSLACSRRGLTEGELKMNAADLTGVEELQPLLRQLRPYLLRRGPLYDFYHSALPEAIRARYFPPESLSEPSLAERQAHLRLARLFECLPCDRRVLDEWPWQLAAAGDWDQLAERLTEAEFFKALWDADEFGLKAYWKLIEAGSPLRMAEAYRSMIIDPEHHPGYPLGQLALLLLETGHSSESLHIWDHLEIAGESIDLTSTGYKAIIYANRGELDRALALLELKEQACHKLGDKSGLGYSLSNQAMIHHARGEFDLALELIREGERICRELQDKIHLPAILGNQAVILQSRGELDRALALHREEERLCRELGNKAQLAKSLGNQGVICRIRGELDRALALQREKECLCRELGDRAGLAKSLGNQAVILQSRGELDRALALHREEERLCRELGDKAQLAKSLGNQAVIFQVRSDLDRVLTLLQEKERICRELGDLRALGACLGQQASFRGARGEFDRALALYREEERLCRELGDRTGLGRCLSDQAMIHQKRGEIDRTLALLEEHERICRELGDKVNLSRSVGSQATIHQNRGELDRALALHREKERLCRELGDPNNLATSLANQGILLAFNCNQVANGQQKLAEALAITRRHGLIDLATQIESLLQRVDRLMEGS
jgi:tetratricopeptide (TPR) repeat protein